MIDKYFKRPIFWGYFLATLISVSITFIVRIEQLKIAKEESLYSIVSDLSTVSLTLAGFILTLLTVLISFKSPAKSKGDINLGTDNLYIIFFSTELYFETVKHLKNAVISLTLIAISGYVLKLMLNPKDYSFLFTSNVFSVVIIFQSLGRCLIILSKIIKIQEPR